LATVLFIPTSPPPADYVSGDFHARLCHVAQNLFADALRGQRDDRHDKAFKEAADCLGEPVAALVAPPDEYRHCSDAACLVVVIVFVELAISSRFHVFLFIVSACD